MRQFIFIILLATGTAAMADQPIALQNEATAKEQAKKEETAKKNLEWQRHLDFLQYLDTHDSK